MNAFLINVVPVLWWFAIGAVIGSFLGVVIERIPAGESIQGRSHCVCGRQLRWWENVPIVAWMALGGKARCCGSRIPVWYTGLEFLCGAMAVLAMIVLGGPWPLRLALLAAGYAVVVVAQIRTRREQS